MQILLIADTETQGSPIDRANERGAALITVLLFSVLLLAAGGALIMNTALSATNSVDATAETQAYYAAEAGMQATLAVLRGHVAPNPLFDTSSSTAAANKISFRQAVTASSSNLSTDTSPFPRLSRWLNYNVALPAPATTGVGLSSPYSSLSGMAYDTKIEDPDNTTAATYSTLGAFGSDVPSPSPVSYQFANGGAFIGTGKVTISYDPQPSISTSVGGTTLGTFHISAISGNPPFATDPKSTFTITIRQISSSGTVDVPVKCTFLLFDPNTVSITFKTPSQTRNLVSGVSYVHVASVNISANGTVSIPVTITPPEPSRLKVTVTGYGPRGAKKQLHMLVSPYAFDFTSPSAITLRSADDNTTVLTFNPGNSSQYLYSGFDNAGGLDTSAFGVTSTPDYNYLTGLALSSSQVKGYPAPIQKLSISSLPTWLQTTDGALGARAFVDTMRTASQIPNAQNQTRYFTTAVQPTSFGTRTNPLFTFVDGNTDLPPAGGAGLLIVTGVFTMNGSSDFAGLILVLGGGQLIRNGGGNGNGLGAIFVARFAATGNFLAPTFNSNGSGNASISHDSDWEQKAGGSTGPRVLAIGEF